MRKEELKAAYEEQLRNMEKNFSGFQMDEVGKRHLKQFITYKFQCGNPENYLSAYNVYFNLLLKVTNVQTGLDFAEAMAEQLGISENALLKVREADLIKDGKLIPDWEFGSGADHRMPKSDSISGFDDF